MAACLFGKSRWHRRQPTEKVSLQLESACSIQRSVLTAAHKSSAEAVSTRKYGLGSGINLKDLRVNPRDRGSVGLNESDWETLISEVPRNAHLGAQSAQGFRKEQCSTNDCEQRKLLNIWELTCGKWAFFEGRLKHLKQCSYAHRRLHASSQMSLCA